MKELNMTHPRINTMTIDAHDEDIPVIRLRFITRPDGTAYFLTKDVGEHLGLNAIETGDCLEVLEHWGVPYAEEAVNDRGKVIGPVGLITEADYRKLSIEAAKLRLDA